MTGDPVRNRSNCMVFESTTVCNTRECIKSGSLRYADKKAKDGRTNRARKKAHACCNLPLAALVAVHLADAQVKRQPGPLRIAPSPAESAAGGAPRPGSSFGTRHESPTGKRPGWSSPIWSVSGEIGTAPSEKAKSMGTIRPAEGASFARATEGTGSRSR